MKRLVPLVLLLTAALLACLVSRPAPAQNVFQYGFETRGPIWVKGHADAPFKEIEHRLTRAGVSAHTGAHSEFISLEVQEGTHVHYTFDVGRAPIAPELAVVVWLRANRPGVKLLCRVVLPRERDPKDLGRPLTVVLPGDAYENTSRWQRLQVLQPVKRLREQQQLLRAQFNRDVITTDAYVDQVILNLYAGPGATQVWTDDLEVGPLEGTSSPIVTAPPPASTDPGRSVQLAINPRTVGISLVGKQLLIGYEKDKNPGEPFFLRGIRYTGTPLKALHQAGFNTVFLDETTPPGLVESAVDQGFWIVPMMHLPEDGGNPNAPAFLASREALGKKVARFLPEESVLFWYLGDQLSREQCTCVSRTASDIRRIDPQRPVSGDVIDGFLGYSGVPQMLMSIHRYPLMTSMDVTNYRDWLIQRRLLAQNPPYCWTWIQTHLPDWFTQVAYDKTGIDKTKEPLGPQPEQIRLLAYTAIGAGFRGLGFWSDRYLADSHTGRDRLLALALLNQELQMLEPLLAGAGEPTWIDTSSPNVKAAVLRSSKAILVLPIWMGAGGQCVPGQSSTISVDVVVPHVPADCQCWEVSPGDLHSLRWDRVVGGHKVTLHEFSMTSALVFTTDLGPNGLVVRLQDHQRRVAQSASQWAYDLAQEELTKVEQVRAQLKQAGRVLPDETQLLEKSHAYLDSASTHQKESQWDEAYADAQRAMRPLRIFMRAHWEKATRELTTPMASPYTLSFYTLPRHWQFCQELQQTKPGGNLLPDGGFEMPPDQVQQGWLRQESPSLDQVKTVARRVAEQPVCEGKQCLMLQVAPSDPALTPGALERTYVAVHTPQVPLRPGSLVRISASVRIPGPIVGSADGVMLYDSAGGEPMALRLVGPLPKWKKFVLYRRVPTTGPSAGVINVSMALTGLGTAYFDDVRIEPLTPDSPNANVQTTAFRPQ